MLLKLNDKLKCSVTLFNNKLLTSKTTTTIIIIIIIMVSIYLTRVLLIIVVFDKEIHYCRSFSSSKDNIPSA
jgi:hypothetical protein